MKKGFKVLIIIAATLAVIITAGAVTVSGMSRGLEDFLSEVNIRPVSLETVSDGTYTGETHAGIIQVQVEVEVEDHRIKDIRLLKHRNGQGTAAEELLNEIISEQRVDLDTVSGATYSSLAIENAVIDALSN